MPSDPPAATGSEMAREILVWWFGEDPESWENHDRHKLLKRIASALDAARREATERAARIANQYESEQRKEPDGGCPFACGDFIAAKIREES